MEAQAWLRQGDRFGRYRILKVLGSGAMGSVYLATDLETYANVALKVLSPDRAGDSELVAAFRKEARLTRDLHHPNLVRCVDSDLDRGHPWIAFEYVSGSSLAEAIRQKGAMDPHLAVSVVLDVAYGLAAAHQRGVFHRDIKPHNILITGDGTVKLIDFGAAAAGPATGLGLRSAAPVGSLDEELDTEHGPWTGTIRYASPEQLHGKELGATSDLYSLGLVFHEVLTGKRLVTASALPEVVMQLTMLGPKMKAPSEVCPGVPTAVDDVVRGMLAFHAERRRFKSAVELIACLESLLTEAWRDSVQRKSQRVLARLSLAETDYERAMRLVQGGRYEEGLMLLGSLLDLPDAMNASYRSRIHDEMRSILCRLHTTFRQEVADAHLSALTRMAVLAHRTEDRDLLLLLARRVATVVREVQGTETQEDHLDRFLTLAPRSIALCTARLALARETGDQSTVERMRLLLADAYRAAGCFDEAAELFRQASREAAHPEEARATLEMILRQAEEAESALEGFDREVAAAVQAGDLEEAVRACRTWRKLAPHDRGVRDRLVGVLVQAGAHDEAREALLDNGRDAFVTDDLDRAQTIFLQLLCMAPADRATVGFLHESLVAEGRASTRAADLDQARLAILLRYGMAEIAIGELKNELAGDDRDLPLLHGVLPLAREAGSGPFMAVVSFQLGKLAMAAGSWDEARAHFAEALENSSAPGSLVDHIRILPNVGKVFRPLDLQRLRRRHQDRQAKKGEEDDR